MSSKSKGAIPIEKILSIGRFRDFGAFPNRVRLCLVSSIFPPNPVKVSLELGKVSKVDNWGNHGGAKA